MEMSNAAGKINTIWYDLRQVLIILCGSRKNTRKPSEKWRKVPEFHFPKSVDTLISTSISEERDPSKILSGFRPGRNLVDYSVKLISTSKSGRNRVEMGGSISTKTWGLVTSPIHYSRTTPGTPVLFFFLSLKIFLNLSSFF